MIRIAIPHWQGRISPVFDVAGNVLVVEVDDGVEQSRQDIVFDIEEPRARAGRLSETRADVLICGAISRPLEVAISAAGVEVISQICGKVESVLAAFAEGRLDQGEFLMPGCCNRRRRFQGGRGGASVDPTERKAVTTMPRGDGAGPTSGGGQGRGRKSGRFAAGPGGQCICPSCGHKASHVQGQPCNQKACPKCGTTMNRG